MKSDDAVLDDDDRTLLVVRLRRDVNFNAPTRKPVHQVSGAPAASRPNRNDLMERLAFIVRRRAVDAEDFHWSGMKRLQRSIAVWRVPDDGGRFGRLILRDATNALSAWIACVNLHGGRHARHTCRPVLITHNDEDAPMFLYAAAARK
jgi:hypothetical protein